MTPFSARSHISRALDSSLPVCSRAKRLNTNSEDPLFMLSQKQMVGVEGLEPSRVASYDFESYAYTNSATRPSFVFKMVMNIFNAIYYHHFCHRGNGTIVMKKRRKINLLRVGSSD